MKHARSIAMLFEKDGKPMVTTMDARSRLRFKKLIRNYVSEGKIFDDAQVGAKFEYVPLNTVLEDIEGYFQTLSSTPAGEHIARNVLKLTQNIRLQNDEEDDENEED